MPVWCGNDWLVFCRPTSIMTDPSQETDGGCLHAACKLLCTFEIVHARLCVSVRGASEG